MVRTEVDKRFKTIAAKRPVRKKPKDKPKRPLSAYNYFFKEERQRILRYIGRRPDEPVQVAVVNPQEESRLWTCTGKVSFEEMGKIIGGRWKAMDSETLKRYTALALGDAGRYKHELKAWNEKKEAEKRNAVGLTYPPYPPNAAPHYPGASPYPLTMPPAQAYHYNQNYPGGPYPPPPTAAGGAPLPPPTSATTTPPTRAAYDPNPVTSSPGGGYPTPYAPPAPESRPNKVASSPTAAKPPAPSSTDKTRYNPPPAEYAGAPSDPPPVPTPPQPSSSPNGNNAPPPAGYYPPPAGQYYAPYNQQQYAKNPPAAQQRWN